MQYSENSWSVGSMEFDRKNESMRSLQGPSSVIERTPSESQLQSV
jgi:hypothetical protein